MLTYIKLKRNGRKCRALTGLTPKEFSVLLPAFTRAYEERYPAEQTMTGKPRTRRVGGGRKGSSLAGGRPPPNTRREDGRVTAQGRSSPDTRPPTPAARSRLIIGDFGPSDSALAAASGWRLLAAQPLTATRHAALLGTCARAAPLGAIRP